VQGKSPGEAWAAFVRESRERGVTLPLQADAVTVSQCQQEVGPDTFRLGRIV